MLKFLKNWTLPLAMFAGAIGYFLLANVTILEPAKPFVNWLIAVLTPFLIFAQLLLTFVRLSPRNYYPRHGTYGYCPFRLYQAALLLCC